MSYNYLGLVNDVCAKVNETELTSSNFSTKLGVYQNIKDSVNKAIRDINQAEYEWPFNHVPQEDSLSAGDIRVPLPVDYKTVDWDSFRVLRDSTIGNSTKKLELIPYEVHQDLYIDHEYNTSDTGIRSLPRTVARTLSDEYVLNPPCDEDYTVAYEYFRHQVDLDSYSDVPAIPEQWRYVIVDGAMYYAELFRGDKEAAMIHQEKFNKSLKDMKRVYTVRTVQIVDTRTPEYTSSYNSFIDIS